MGWVIKYILIPHGMGNQTHPYTTWDG